MKYNKGFSFIEAIVSLSIISLLTLIVIPQLSILFLKYKEQQQYLLMQQTLLEEIVYCQQQHIQYYYTERYPYVIAISPHELSIKNNEKSLSISYQS